ncbi:MULTISPECIES: 2-oxo-4-hydroxy-4-carboxy-5-ureidoimidazoline decarboxylase [Mycolicibacterium]|uniref:2-oxo-4-hydroxy-4-carboxy-5-ureidoimidazoline decarboxylase n=1 Tax=Mycolicibacterium pallens TaxID=370524 RepID=A0ABX8VL22_9MYCO|nr:2-oxo-4-hydroxy-4-carboxy-5-ureidoimidazoline decarboxylase [Mycolicibacterium pallens]APE18043.1 2-oxo-4-hydroxy-4-carboxy-5-ureidoimidazoline decarboxylase [Mycobacterium sp. WY10]QYL16490.1 2-oxo-4-hydroxy-4-carboxy-5-ureidoimidazoline decarboxylase [Mycolicibacterium pallens]
MLLHQGIGLDAFNELPDSKAVHALYECCNSVTLARDLTRGRPYADRTELFRRADDLLFSLSESSIDDILQAYPHVGRRPGSTKSQAEQCSVWDSSPEVMAELTTAVNEYTEHFGFGFVMHVGGLDREACARSVIAAVRDRMHHDPETERKVVCNELARINRSRLERMLGPEGGYDNWG